MFTVHIQWQRLDKAFWERAAYGMHYLPEKIAKVFQLGGFELPPLTRDELISFASWAVNDYGLPLAPFEVYDENNQFVPWSRIL